MKITFSPENLPTIKQQILIWGNAQSEIVCCLDSNDYQKDKYKKYECLIAVGTKAELKIEKAGNAFEQLKDFSKEHQNWLFGYFGYDLKNEVERLESNNPDGLHFPEMHFFSPTYLFIFHINNELEIQSQKKDAEAIWNAIQLVHIPIPATTGKLNLQQKLSKENYLQTILKIKQHIIDGDIYEMNFCQEFFVENAAISPLSMYFKMNDLAKAPFSAYFKNQHHHLLCGSPERFMCKRGNKIISQPIKGTIRRGKKTEEDQNLRNQLYYSPKDRAENIMIVDLVRNDLTKTCQTGTIKVEELFEIYAFQRVFQMISTITGNLQTDKDWIDCIKAAFPMGSMTGAPKVMSMELIEHYEQSKRGLYSGALGYISPDGDFDFNVVIRSLFYNAQNQYLSFHVGGAIVYDSEPEAEYEECLLKAKTMLEVLGEN